MSVANSTVLELSATAYWLRHDESFSDWKKELVKRKGQKTEAGRLEKAEQLLANLGLN
jgi:hypothetical protein